MTNCPNPPPVSAATPATDSADTAAQTGPNDALRAKQAFLAHMRHELRTPINAIIGYSELLLEDSGKPELAAAGADLQRILVAGRQLLGLVNDLLSAGRIESQTELDVAKLGDDTRHALRTPIATVTGYAELLIEEAEEAGQGELVADLRRIVAAAQTLVAGINDIVGYTEAEQTLLSRPDDAVVAMVHAAVSAIQPLVQGPAADARENTGSLLVVDDNATNRDLLARQLQRRGHTVTAAENGRQALALMGQSSFDLVLLDIVMPEMNGYEVLQRLKAEQSYRHVPVIMISALDEMDSIVRCIEAGAEDYLPRPFSPVLLHARIGAALEKKRLHDLEQRYLANLQAEWERSKRLEGSLRQVVRYSVQKPPEEMLGASLAILVELAGARAGLILEEDGANLQVLCATLPELMGRVVPWDCVAGETFRQNVIVYSRGAAELSYYGLPVDGGGTAATYLLSVPVPHVISVRQTQTALRCSGVLQLLFAHPALPGVALEAGAVRLGVDLSDRHDSQDRLLQELFLILPTLSLGMEIQNLRQTSYQAIHELKNKLIAALSWTNCLREDLEELAPAALQDEGVREDLELITEAVAAGQKLAVGYLQFTKIYNPHFEPCDLNQILSQTATDIQAFADHAAGRRSVTVGTNLDPAVPVRDLDPAQLKMAFFNLGKNAAEALLEHGVAEPRITLASAQQGKTTTVTVADNGRGLPAEVAQSLFVAFTSKKSGGTGLGLTITKKIVGMHGGTIACTSSSAGTVFCITL